MARNLPSKTEDAQSQPPESAHALMPGGALGVVPLAGAGAPELRVPEAPARDLASVPKPRRYRVVNGGVVMYASCKTVLRAGKEVSESEYDVAALRRQGILLQELQDEQPGAA